MKYQFEEVFLKNMLRDYSRTIVGRLCKQVETLQSSLDKNSEEFKYLSHVKNLHRESIYEMFRDLENQLKAYQEGRKFTNFSIYSPSQSKKD